MKKFFLPILGLTALIAMSFTSRNSIKTSELKRTEKIDFKIDSSKMIYGKIIVDGSVLQSQQVCCLMLCPDSPNQKDSSVKLDQVLKKY